MELTELEKDILSYSSDDWMGLWVVVDYVYGDAYLEDEYPWVREKTLDIVSGMLSKGLIRVGQFVRWNGKLAFEPYSLPDDEIIQRIEKEWNELGRPPNIGDTFWIVATEAGEKLAHELGI